MTLFSEIDWIVLIGVGAFFLLGRDGGAILRQLGRWYGRAVHLKRELLAELTQAADLPRVPGGAGPGSLRALLLGAEPALRPAPGVAASPPRGSSEPAAGGGPASSGAGERR